MYLHCSFICFNHPASTCWAVALGMCGVGGEGAGPNREARPRLCPSRGDGHRPGQRRGQRLELRTEEAGKRPGQPLLPTPASRTHLDVGHDGALKGQLCIIIRLDSAHVTRRRDGSPRTQRTRTGHWLTAGLCAAGAAGRTWGPQPTVLRTFQTGSAGGPRSWGPGAGVSSCQPLGSLG